MFLILLLLWRVYADVRGHKKVCVCGLGITKNIFAPEFGTPVTTYLYISVYYLFSTPVVLYKCSHKC